MVVENVGSFQYLVYKMFLKNTKFGPEKKLRALNF